MASAVVHRVDIPDRDRVGNRYPLNRLKAKHASAFHEKYQLPIDKAVFVRGVLALRSQVDIQPKFNEIKATRSPDSNEWNEPIELSIGQHTFTRLESEVIYKAWTRDEWETLMNLSRLHRLLIVACSFAAMTQGWDQAAMAGAAIEAMRDLGKPTISGSEQGDVNRNTWLLGLTIGVSFFAGAILGLLMTDPMTSFFQFGRRGAICAAGAFSFISVIGSASVHKWEDLLGFRIMLGAGMAGKASIVPILLSETSPKNVRGFLLVFWQLFVAFGLAAGSVANLSVYRLNPSSSWRYMFISAFIPALLLLSLVLFSPESPRWLLKESGAVKKLAQDDPRRGVFVRKAFKSLVDLRGEPVPILAAGELFLMHSRLIEEQRRLSEALLGRSSSTTHTSQDPARFGKAITHIGWEKRVELMFFKSGYTKRAHRAAAAVMVSQQLCGINLIAFLADTFFRYSFFPHSHNRETSPSQNIQLLGASFGLMLLNFIATIPALFVIEINDGRRLVLNWSFPIMAVSLLGSALTLKLPKNNLDQPSIGAIVGHYICLALFTIAYSIGEGPAAFVISAEVFPLVNRELGMSLAVFWNFIGAGLLAVLAPWLLIKLDQFGVLLLFAGLNLIAWFLCFWLVPSTGREDLETVFEQLDITSWFMFTYTFKSISKAVTQPIDYCLRLSGNSWKESGLPSKLGSARAEWKRRQAELTTEMGTELRPRESLESNSSEDDPPLVLR